MCPTPVVCTFVFQPQSLLEQLSRYKRAAAEEELREKQLGALRVDLCSPEALKRLKGQLVSSGLPLLHRRHLFIFLSSPQTFIPCKRLTVTFPGLFSFCPTDKAEGNKFAKDFEDNSQKLQEFVGFLEKELKSGPPLLDALRNADIFYEMQYKEVKIVANVSVL